MSKLWSFIFSRRSILGIAVLGWTMLAHASTAQFTWNLGSHMNSWLDAHAWAGFLAGFILLAITFAWPELKKKFPDWFKIPKTLHERVELLETDLQTKLSATGGQFAEIQESVRLLAAFADKTIEGMALVQEVTTSTSERVFKCQSEVTQTSSKMLSMDRRVRDVEQRIEPSMQHSVFIDEVIQEKLVPRLDSAHSRLDEHRPWIAELERRLTDLEKSS